MNKGLKHVGGVLLSVVLMFSFAFNTPSNASATNFGVDNVAATGGIGNTIDPCLNNGGAFGFVFCPAVDVFASVIDYFLSTMQSGFNWSYLIETGGDELPVLEVWSSLLPIANILFALVFLIVIYSIATGSGLNNYSVKKIMPRLIVIAIAVNVSYYICAALIDISNIVGTSIYDFIFDTLSRGDTGMSFTQLANSVFSNSSSGANLVGASGSIGALLILVVCMTVVLLGVGAVFISVAARNVLLVMLLLSAPLAFIAALLPNTENLFRKWGNNFLRLLVVYPAFMFVWAICRALQAVFLDSDASALDLILSMLLSVAPAVVIIPLFKASGGLMGKVAGVIQRGGSSGSTSSTTTNSEATNKKMNSQTIDKVNQKKFTSNTSTVSNKVNNSSSGVQTTLPDGSNSASNNNTAIIASEIASETRVKPPSGDRKSNRSRAISTNLKSKVESLSMQGASTSPLGGINNMSNATSSTNTTGDSSSRMFSRQASSSNQTNTSNNSNSSTANTSNTSKLDLNGEFDRLSDVLKAKDSDSTQPALTRERALSGTKDPTPTPRKQMFADTVAGDKKIEGTFDISNKGHSTNVFAGDGQNVTIENSGGTSQTISGNVMDGGLMPEDTPSIVPAEQDNEVKPDEALISEDVNNTDIKNGNELNPLTENIRGRNQTEANDNVIASAPSIVQNIVSDDDRKNRFANPVGQKELAKMLTTANVKQFLPSDIDYILGIGPLLDKNGGELAPISDISNEPEYKTAVQAIIGYISTLSDEEKKNPTIFKWQKELNI